MNPKVLGIQRRDCRDMSVIELSKLLFNEVKPYCTELSNLSLLPVPVFKSDSPQLIHALANIQSTIESHYSRHKLNGRYQLAANIADYIFFPLSNLLQKPSLNDTVIQYIFGILAFLLEHVWAGQEPVPNQQLMAQLYPLVIFLMTGNDKKLDNVTLEFKANGLKCLQHILSCLSNDFFIEVKNLTLLGKTITLILDILSSCENPTSAEEIQLVNDCLTTIDNLYSSYLSLEQLSHVLPGTVSKVINFYTQSKTLHYTIIANILITLRHLIVKVFNDKDLKIEYIPKDEYKDLESLWEKKQDAQENEVLSFAIPSTSTKSVHRTTSWLKATSKQLKISLTILFKDLLGTSSNNKLKVQTKKQIEDQVVLFVESVLKECFISLFNELIVLSLDILPMLITNVTENQTIEEGTDMVLNLSKVFLVEDNLQKEELFSQVSAKLEDLVKNKISSIMLSVNDDRIRLYLISVKFQFLILNELSKSMGPEKAEILITLTGDLLDCLQLEMVRGVTYNSKQKKIGNKDILSILSGANDNKHELQEKGVLKEENNLDGIELPPSIDAKKVTSIKQPLSDLKSIDSSYTANMSILAKSSWTEREEERKIGYFSNVYTTRLEVEIVELIKFLGYLSKNADITTSLIERVLASEVNSDSESELYLYKSVNLWFANNLLEKLSDSNAIEQKFDIDEFLVFDDNTQEPQSQAERFPGIENISYLILEKSQTLIDEMTSKLNSPQTLDHSSSALTSYRVYEMTYSIAIDSIGILSNGLSFEDFQQDFLIDYLYPLLEALTYQSNPIIQQHAKTSLQLIVKNYYNGSLINLIMDNLDYLIDCLSLKLSVASSLTPSIPGILLVILKISGIELLLTNQLNDILSEMFTLIDSYHGYSSLVEGFFFVFGELIQQIEHHYNIQNEKKRGDGIVASNSRYKPWGMKNIDQVLKLIDDSEKIIDPFKNYDSKKEYFKRKRDVPFSEQMEDSDDEDDVDEDNDEKMGGVDSGEVATWDSEIPKQIYEIIQKLFNYSFRLLSHPSKTLKFQILTMLNKIYPLLSSNYNMALPLISKHWPILLGLVTGTENLSSDSNLSTANLNLIVPALELTTTIIREDEIQGEAFLGRKFIEMWDFLTSKSTIFKNQPSKPSQSLLSVSTILYSPNMISCYVTLILTGLKVYERVIPDTIAYEMTEFCWRSGIKKAHELSTETKNIIWVLQQQNM